MLHERTLTCLGCEHAFRRWQRDFLTRQRPTFKKRNWAARFIKEVMQRVQRLLI